MTPSPRTNEEQDMPGNLRGMITVAERHFPVRIRLGVPPGGLGQRYSELTGWLDQNCGADGWAIMPSGVRGVLNDAISIYFGDTTLASAFVAGGARGQGRRPPAGCFRCARANLRRGSERDCTGRRELDRGVRRPSRYPRLNPADLRNRGQNR